MNVTPYANISEGKKQQVEKMFNNIASRYDLLNSLLSFGIHKRWRKKTIRLLDSSSVNRYPSFSVLDVATGTGDFAIDALALKPTKVTGIDISEEMLAEGRKKIQKQNVAGVIELQKADSENLPFAAETFDAATVGFGVRNFENLEKGLLEISRVLKKKGTLAVLEFSMPGKFPMKQLYNFYLKNMCPLFGRIISGNTVAYFYLFQSVRNFPHGENFKSILLKSGFSHVRYYPQTFGVVTIYLATK